MLSLRGKPGMALAYAEFIQHPFQRKDSQTPPLSQAKLGNQVPQDDRQTRSEAFRAGPWG